MTPSVAHVTSSGIWQVAGWTMVHYLWVGTLVWLIAAAARLIIRSSRPRVRYAHALISLLSLAVGLAATAVGVACAGSGPTNPAWIVGVPRVLGERLPAALAAAVPWLPWIWIAGGGAILCLMALGLAGAERLRGAGVLQCEGVLAEQCRRLARSMGIFRPVSVAICERASLPMLVGILRPMILLPPAALGVWTSEDLEMVLLHELAHIRRWDNLVVVLQRLIESLLFFHPAVWIVSAWVQREREFCCDEFVVTRTNRPREYARMLTDLAAGHAARQWALACSLGRWHLVARVRHILNREEESMHVSRFAASCLTGCFVAGWGLLLWQGAEAGRPPAPPARSERVERPPQVARAELPEFIAEPSREPDAAIEPPALTKAQIVVDGDAVVVVEAAIVNRAWGPEQAEGPPNTNEAGDIQTAWASQTPDDQPEWIICRFATAVDLKSVVIHETFNPGAVVKVSAFDAQNKEVVIWEGVDPTPRDAAKGVSTIPVKADFKINRVKIYVDSPAVPGWNEIDAVGLRDVAGEVQWASKVEVSSTFASDNAPFAGAPGKRGWGPEQAEGPPDTPEAGDIVTAWASLTTDGQAEWLICKYAQAVEPRAIVIHETYNPGAVIKVSAFDPENKEVVIWEGVDPTPRDVPKGISVIPVKVKFKIDRIKIYVDSPAVPGWNEIDAVGLRDAAGETQWASKVEASTTYAMQQAQPAPPSIVIRAEELERLRRVDAEVKELRKEVDRLKRLEADVEELKKLIKERQP